MSIWEDIIRDQVLTDDKKKITFANEVGLNKSVYSMESCRLNEGDEITVIATTTVTLGRKGKKEDLFVLRLVKKYPHICQFENIDGRAVNNYICFNYLDTELIMQGKLIPELY